MVLAAVAVLEIQARPFPLSVRFGAPVVEAATKALVSVLRLMVCVPENALNTATAFVLFGARLRNLDDAVSMLLTIGLMLLMLTVSREAKVRRSQTDPNGLL